MAVYTMLPKVTLALSSKDHLLLLLGLDGVGGTVHNPTVTVNGTCGIFQNRLYLSAPIYVTSMVLIGSGSIGWLFLPSARSVLFGLRQSHMRAMLSSNSKLSE